ncbi:MAG: acyltransferase, partial [Pseudomonadota bacterium]
MQVEAVSEAQSMSATPDYRADLDGMRAIAVIAVIIYHLDGSWLPGGFAGVDVFFVLSGFFITRLLARELEGGSLDLLGFYET